MSRLWRIPAICCEHKITVALIDASISRKSDRWLSPGTHSTTISRKITTIRIIPSLWREIKARVSAKGFTGEYFADEILWHTRDEDNFDNGPPVSKIISAKYYLRTITEHRGLGVNVTINTFFQEPVDGCHSKSE